jgi:predicted AAA+ superfamily ATPase
VLLCHAGRTVFTLAFRAARGLRYGTQPSGFPGDDRLDARAAAASDLAFIVSGPGPVLIDEFQHVPEILDAIKAELNTDTTPGRYVLTGSTRYSVLPQAAPSLTGRAHIINYSRPDH